MKPCVSCLLLALTPLLASAVEPSASVRVAILVADAEELYREGDRAGAVKLYDRAAAKAFAEGAKGRAFELSRTSAAIVQASGKNAEAGARLRRLALASVDHPDAPAAHHAAIVCLAQTVGSSRAASNAYSEALDEFLEQWPDDPHAPQVQWWQSQWIAAQGTWDQAFATLTRYQPGSPRFSDAMTALAHTASHRVQQLKSQNAQPSVVKQLVLSATAVLQPLIVSRDGRWPEAWTLTQREIALSLAELHLAYQDSGPEYPYRLLTAAVSGEPGPDSAWLAAAAPRLVEACVRAGHYSKATQWCAKLSNEQIDSSSRRQLCEVLQVQALDGENKKETGEVLLAAIDRLNDQPLPPWALTAKAIALNATGDSAGALETLALVESPQDAWLVERVRASALLASASVEGQQQALDLWRRAESRHRTGSVDWYRARLARIQLLIRTGEREEAAKLLKLTTALYARPNDAEQQENLDELSLRLK